MSKIFKINAYKIGSQSAKALAEGLGCKRIKPTFQRKARHIIINWGKPSNTQVGFQQGDLNNPTAISLAANKISTLETINSINDLRWTTDRSEASTWNGKIYCRTSLSGHSGEGIVVAETFQDLVRAPLYTADSRHKYEFRIHVFQGTAIDVQQKKRRHDYEGESTGIRNHANGYIYARSDVTVPEKVLTKAIEAVRLLGLDFGAVDVGYRERDNTVHIFEVNTAPGITGTTLENYVETFSNYLRRVNA